MIRTIPPDIAARIAARLPENRTVDNLRIVTAQGAIVPQAELTDAERALAVAKLASELETAGGPPMLTNGTPTIMRIVAWLAHDGINKNRLAFVADDFGAAADQIREPNFLVMDFNHSAVLPFSFDQKAIGVWYRAEKRWDPKANEGRGAYGILASGIMWAWAFPDYANTMLAEQERNGHLDFSMACLPTSLTLAHDANGAYEIAHQPVFLTLSALDVAPADVDAIGRGVEGSNDPALEQQLTQQLTGTSHTMMQAASETRPPVDMTEEEMDELKEQIAALTAQLEAANAALASLTATEERVTVLASENEALKTQIAELTTAKSALETTAAALKQEAESLNEKLTAAEGQLAEIAAKTEAETKVTRYEARLAELPEAYRTALAERAEDDQARFAKKWTEATDDEWSEFKSEIEFAFSKVKLSYRDRSQREGSLPTGGTTDSDDVAALVSQIKK
jgi:hypothetical protein